MTASNKADPYLWQLKMATLLVVNHTYQVSLTVKGIFDLLSLFVKSKFAKLLHPA